MPVSALDLFTIGLGPSSSHTVGPMRAARQFVKQLEADGLGEQVSAVRCDLYGSLAATGKGHGTDKAILLGFLGEQPEKTDLDAVEGKLQRIADEQSLELPWEKTIAFNPKEDLQFKRVEPLPLHPNGMHFTATDAGGKVLSDAVVYSVGGGFIATEEDLGKPLIEGEGFPYPFESAEQLMELCDQHNLSVSELMMRNESAFRSKRLTCDRLEEIWRAMQACVERGCQGEGNLPGGLKVKRRAKAIHEKLQKSSESSLRDPLTILDWVNLYALAVNEENAAGGRVVTAPTNGAAGIIPAVLHYAVRFRDSPHQDGVHRFLLTAAAIGMLYKRNASISGAEAGCQGEVGVACSMAAAGLVEYLGGTPTQVENAAEVGMEHNLGLTCDPVGGLVQIPCIERNAMGAVKAINAARLAMSGDGSHFVSLDKVIQTMRDTGRDMSSKYKETSRGGLAVSVVEC